MRNTSPRSLGVSLLAACLATLVSTVVWSAGSQIPVAVSPGAGVGFELVADSCATFSWAGVESASGYALAVYEVTEDGQLGRPVIHQNLPSGASSWTVPAGHCLSREMTYAWTVGAAAAKGEATWSNPVLFRIAPGPTEAEFEQALAVVRSYLAHQDESAASESAIASPEASVTDGLKAAAEPAPAAPAATDLSVEGGVEAASFKGDGSELTAVDADTLDGLDSAELTTDAELTLHEGDPDAHFSHASSLAELNTQTGASLADGPHTVDTTCDGAACDGANFTNITAVSATSLMTDGTNCAADQAAGGVDAAGNAQDCRDQADLTGFGSANTRVGTAALAANTTGSRNTASGYQALSSNTSGFYNTASGFRALASNTSGGENTASGHRALADNTSGSRNTAVGNFALSYNTTGFRNTAVGDRVLFFNTEGFFNTAIGYQALFSNSTGSDNTANGIVALSNNTTGRRNTASGSGALSANTAGDRNTASGFSALSSNTIGSNNTASGYRALHYNTTGDRNTVSGNRALHDNTTGSDNTAIGQFAGHDATTGNDNIFIANRGVAGDDSKIRIGTQGTQTATYMAGIHGTSLAGNSVVVTPSGQLGVASGATGDADTLDGLDSTDFTTDAELATHAGVADVHHAPTVDTDTTCDGAACDGTNFGNVTAVAGDSATGFFATGQIEAARIDDAIARDGEIPSLVMAAVEGGECPGSESSTDRFTDCGNGTIRDNNTGLLWLKDASCADLPGTDSEGRASWAVAESAAAALAHGICGLTDGSVAGNWRQATALEWCSAAPVSSFKCPSANAADSLLNTNFFDPAISNAAGDAQWSEGDPFVGVVASWYQTATRTTSIDNWLYSTYDGSAVNGSGPYYVWPVREALEGFASQADLDAHESNADAHREHATLEESGEIDSDIATHAALTDVHHTLPTALPPSGAAGGELTGTYPNPGIVDTVARDSEVTADIATHTALADAHREHATLEESAEIDSDIASHAALPNVHHIPTTDTDTTLTEAQVETFVTNGPLDGTNFTNLSGSNVTTGTVAEPRIADEIARDSEVSAKFLALKRCAVDGWRYADMSDGTVLDCNTGLYWLKNARCLTLGPHGDGYGNWPEALTAAAALADGECGLSDGSSAGDWRLPTPSEFCSAWAGSWLPCPAGAASDSLIDSSVSGAPKLVNAKGDAQWSEGDAFVGVESQHYWTNMESGENTAWAGSLGDSWVYDNDLKVGVQNFIWPVRGGQ